MAHEHLLRIFLIATLLSPSRRQLALGYATGQDITLCWTSASGGEPQQGECDGAEVAFTSDWPENVVDGEAFDVKYQATLPSELMPKPAVLANVHACDRSVGFCTPFVEADSSEVLQGTLDGAEVSFESRVSYPAGQFTLIAVVNWEDMMGAVHYIARARQVDVEEPTSPFVYGLIAMGAGVALLLLGVGGYLAHIVYKKFKHLREVAKRSYYERVERVLQAYGQTRRLAYPMVCISYQNFKAQGKMVTHEFARANKLLFFFDTVNQILQIESEEKNIVFISHQWTGNGVPDPTGVQFQTIVKAIDAIAEKNNLEMSSLLVWIDYTSIPQRSRALQTLSIGSLPVYATFASHFLVVAPAVEAAPSRSYSLGTYKVRGWCRLEQWARLAQRSVENMWICDGSSENGEAAYPASNDATFAATAMRVFQGDFTVDHDRFKLIDVLVGLYAMLMERSDNAAMNPSMKSLIDEVTANSKTVYPTEYFEDLLDIASTLGKEGFFKEIDKEHHSFHMETIMETIREHARRHVGSKGSSSIESFEGKKSI